jgi:hypothetical protein
MRVQFISHVSMLPIPTISKLSKRSLASQDFAHQAEGKAKHGCTALQIK